MTPILVGFDMKLRCSTGVCQLARTVGYEIIGERTEFLNMKACKSSRDLLLIYPGNKNEAKMKSMCDFDAQW